MEEIITRERCYTCFRPMSSCMCKYTKKIETNTKFVILMHNKEFQKTKNGTGILTSLNLSNSVIFRGVDFTNHKQLNTILNDESNECYILYPSNDAINLSSEELPKNNKQKVLILIDSTWACSKTLLASSKNLQTLPRISFDVKKHSQFVFKTQPTSYCLSTIETTQAILHLLNQQDIEKLRDNEIENFIQPFEMMVRYQIKRATKDNTIRYKERLAYKKK